ncbi:MAG: thioredoxin domain-containing protein [Eubacteriales bacterium]
MVILTQDNFAAEVLEYQGAVLIDFYADWCAPCRLMASIVEQLEQECPDTKFGKVNVDEQAALAMQFDIQSIPTLALVMGAEVRAVRVGIRPKEELLALLRAEQTESTR